MRALLYKLRRAFLSGTFINHYITNKSFRVNISLFVSLILNLIYLIFNFVSGIKYKSLPFIAVSVYYALHICIRYIILNLSDKEGGNKKELAACKKGGILLLVADVLITPMLIFGAFSQNAGSYGALVIVFLSSYAAYTLISASVGIVASARENIPVRRAAYSVRFSSGAVSLFNLVSALSRSSLGNELLSESLNIVLGATVSLFILYLSIKMIFHP